MSGNPPSPGDGVAGSDAEWLATDHCRDRISSVLVVWPLRVLSFSAVLTLTVLSAQLPPSKDLSPQDNKAFTQELHRVLDLLGSANDKGSVEFQVARTDAAGGQYRDAMEWLKKVVDSNLGFDPSRDKLFDDLRNSREFQSLEGEVRAQTPPVSNSRLVATVPEPDLFPENLAYDPSTKTFFLGSTFKDEIVRCDRHGTCEPFVAPHRDDLGSVLGLKVDRLSRTLWATSNTDHGASLRHYNLASGKLIRSYSLSGAHLFNDLVIASNGEVFVTDTKQGAVYKISGGNRKLEPLVPGHVFTAANGIALSPDQKALFVASFGDGISAIDLASQSVKPLPHPAGVCLGYIDGLYALKRGLIAIQNGPMVPRIVRFELSADGGEILGMKILERRNLLFGGITTGALIGDRLYYIANSQLDKVAEGKIKSHLKLDPLRILRIDVQTR